MKIVAAGAVSSDPAPAATAERDAAPFAFGSDTRVGEFPPLPLPGPVSTTTPRRILGGTVRRGAAATQKG